MSRCLGFDACRYDGEEIPCPFLARLAERAELLPVCPELEIGLGVPREPIRLVADPAGGTVRLLGPSTDLDLTARMREFADRFLGRLGGVDGFVLKARSPSCAVRDGRVHRGPDGAGAAGRAPGVFAAEVLRRFPGVAVEDESRLEDRRVRERFLLRVFTAAAFRVVRERASRPGARPRGWRGRA